MAPPRYEVHSRRQVFKGRVFGVCQDRMTLPNGHTATVDVVEHHGAVAVVPVDAKGRILLIRQFRPALRKEMLEIPAGSLKEGEDPRWCVQRELREETGYRAARLRGMGGFYSAPGFCTEYLYLYLATGLRPDPLPGDEDEAIRLVPTSPSRIPGLVRSGAICDAKSIAGLLTYLTLYRSSTPALASP
ncbi:MAG: NUDIX hydrolase [Chloroflexi bacterium]|nr:NUDIX hydrolase [Chloroflexota bacterium]